MWFYVVCRDLHSIRLLVAGGGGGVWSDIGGGER